MSFFFANVKREPKKKPVARAAPRNAVSVRMKQSASTLNRLGCKVCPLANMGDRVNASTSKPVDVFFLSEGPNANDVNKGKPLYGKAGRLVRDLIDEHFEGKVGFGTIVQHRPPNDREPAWAEIEHCRGHVTAAIEKARPKLIVGLGLQVMQWVLGSADMTGMRGRIFSVKIGEHKCFFMPTFSPVFVMKSAYDDARPLQSRMGHAFRMDFQTAFEYLEEKNKPIIITPTEAKEHVHTFNGSRTSFLGLHELLEQFEAAKKSRKWSLDFETYPLRPYSKDAAVLTASISYWVGKRIETFAFAIDHPKAGWTKKERETILDSFLELVKQRKSTKIAHNVPFELEWLLFLFGTEIVDHRGWEDTMMMAHLIDERKGQGREQDRRPTYQNLNFLCKQLLGLELKSMFKLDKKDMRKSDLDECLLYNGCDSKYTLLLHQIQHAALVSQGLVDLFEFIKPRQTTVALMQHFGIPMNHKLTRKFQKRLAKEIKSIEEEISELKVIKQYNLDKGRKFNPQSQPELVEILRDYLKRTEIKVAGKKYGDPDRIAVDKGVLDKIDHPIAPLILKLRNRQKLKSTYVDEFVMGEGKLIYPDGMLHTNFNTTFTTSGRLSSDDPNMQNFPKRDDKWVREQITAPPGYVLVSVDYGQLEWCLACICCKDKVMVDATWTGYDVHMEWATKIAKLWPKLVGGKKYIKNRDTEESKKKYKYARGLVKNKMVFPVIFGATEESVRNYLNMPEDVAKEIFKEFWDTFSGLGDWQKRLMKGYYNDGFVENLFGRKRRYPMTKNEAINFPIQSTAAEIVCDAMDRLSMLAIKTGNMFIHPRLNIHDDLTFIMPNDEQIIDENLDIIISEMLKLPFDFVNVPMSVEVSIGTNWENQEEIGKFFTTDIGRHSLDDAPKSVRRKLK